MYECLICPNTNFDSNESLNQHLINHNQQHCCNECGETIRNQENQIKCEYCNAEYYTEEHMKIHQYLYSVDQLNVIVKMIYKEEIVNNNKILKYKGNKPICPVDNCNQKFETQNELIGHFIDHVEYTKCEFCDEILPTENELNVHIERKICQRLSDECDDFLHNDDIIDRMTILIKNLEDVKFTNIKYSNIFSQELRNPICIKNDYDCFNLDQVLPKVLELRNKRFNSKINEIDESEMEPPVKKSRIESDFNTSDCLDEIEALIVSDDEDEIIPNKRIRY